MNLWSKTGQKNTPRIQLFLLLTLSPPHVPADLSGTLTGGWISVRALGMLLTHETGHMAVAVLMMEITAS